MENVWIESKCDLFLTLRPRSNVVLRVRSIDLCLFCSSALYSYSNRNVIILYISFCWATNISVNFEIKSSTLVHCAKKHTHTPYVYFYVLHVVDSTCGHYQLYNGILIGSLALSASHATDFQFLKNFIFDFTLDFCETHRDKLTPHHSNKDFNTHRHTSDHPLKLHQTASVFLSIEWDFIRVQLKNWE